MLIFRILAGSLLLVSLACRAPREAAPEQPRPVQLRSPRLLEQPERIRASGSVEARATAKLGFEVAGRIAAVKVEEGDAVAAGAVLAELVATDYELDARAAAADAHAARELARKAAAGTRRQELEQARAAFAQADDEYRRLKTLYERQSLAPVDYHKIEAKWKAAREQLALAEEGAREEDRRAAEAQAEKAAAALEFKKKRLGDTRLRAPFAGVVARRMAEPGDIVAAGMPVVVLMALDPVRVSVGVAEREVGRLRRGQRAQVRIPSLEERVFAGSVELVGFAADPASRSFPVKILTANPGYLLRAGMVAEAEIETDRKQQLLTVPAEAVLRDEQGVTYVYVYFPDKQRVFRRTITVGGVAGTEVEVVSGLAAADKVVVAGQQLLREGALVRTQGGVQ